jgi:hypothetical protein
MPDLLRFFARRLGQIMPWTHDELISGERLQALAETTILTPSILAFHRSLRQTGVRRVVSFRGSHRQIEHDPAALAQLEGARSIFVYTHLLPAFIDQVLPFLDDPFVLVTHNSDDCVDERFLPLLDDERLAHWFAQNAVIDHAKLTPLPIGVANAQWPHGNLNDLAELCAQAPASRRLAVYSNFDVRTNPAVRQPLLALFSSRPFIWQAPARPYRDYLADMAGCRWCVSPPGNGVDCHRTWEALYLGVIPVVLRTAWGAKLHDGLPVAQVDDFADMTLEALQLQCENFPAHDFAPLLLSYWRKRIRDEVEKI